jgi:hypothetical protein
MLIEISAQTSNPNSISCKLDSLYFTELDSYITLAIHEPEIRTTGEEVIPILYIFGDVFFESFSGSINYLHNELELIPNCILIGINEIPDKQFGTYQEEYANFISKELIEQLSMKYNLNSDGILFGHSRASRLVGKVIQKNPDQIKGFILSAPWFNSEYLLDLEKLFSVKSEIISIYYSLSEEDCEMPQIKEAKIAFASLLNEHGSVVRSEYQFFENETHMTIPPLSFYYGIKYLLH